MAKQTRSQLSDNDTNIYLPDNVTQDIDPVDHRDSNIDHADSTINQLDDNVFVNPVNQTVDYIADPLLVRSDSSQNLAWANKGYVDQEVTFLDTKTYYLSEDGDDIIAEPGNAIKPFGTPAGLIAAVSSLSAGSVVQIVVYPGTYSGDFIILTGDYYITMDMRGVNWTSGKFQFGQHFRVTINATGSSFQNNEDWVFAFENVVFAQMFGGRLIHNRAVSGNGALRSTNTGVHTFYNLYIESTGAASCFAGNIASFFNCVMVCEEGSAVVIRSCRFDSCFLQSNSDVRSTVQDVFSTSSIFNNCRIVNQGTNYVSSALDANQSSFKDCELISENGSCVEFRSSGAIITIEMFFRSCLMRAAVDVFDINSNMRVSQDIYVENCRLEAGTGNIFEEPASYSVDFTAVIRSVNNFYNKAFTPGPANKIIEYNKQVK